MKALLLVLAVLISHGLLIFYIQKKQKKAFLEYFKETANSDYSLDSTAQLSNEKETE